MTLRFGSLFTGIAGLDIGFEWEGWECAFQIENDDYCTRVLEYRYPGIPRWRDIREVDIDDVLRRAGAVDALIGGFPCQDVSNANSTGKGLAGSRSGLWSEFARLVSGIRPRYVVVENVPGLLWRGMDRVLADLAVLGYDAEWETFPAALVGAPHLRWRVFLVAYPNGEGLLGESVSDSKRQAIRHTSRSGEKISNPGEWTRWVQQEPVPECEGSTVSGDSDRAGREQREMADTNGCGLSEGMRDIHARERDTGGRSQEADADANGERSQGIVRTEGGERISVGAQPRGFREEVPNANGPGLQEQRRALSVFTEIPPAELFGGWEAEPEMGRVVDGFPGRVDQIRCLGNAVVPKQARYVAWSLRRFHERRTRMDHQ